MANGEIEKRTVRRITNAHRHRAVARKAKENVSSFFSFAVGDESRQGCIFAMIGNNLLCAMKGSETR